MLPNVYPRINGYCHFQKHREFHSLFLYLLKRMKPEAFSQKVILSHPRDNVAPAKFPISPGTLLQLPKGKMIKLEEEIPFGHKIALRRIPKCGAVIKYGERIGKAIREIKTRELVHIHNVVGEWGKRKGN